MKEKHIVESIKNGGNAGWLAAREDGKVIVKLEGYITGKQADLTVKLLREKRGTKAYDTQLKELQALEKENGFIYDLSPSYII